MMISIEMQTACVCPHCNVRNPLPGLRTELECYACAKSIDLAELMLEARTGGTRYHFGGYYDVVAEAVLLLDEGGACVVNKMKGQSATRTEIFRRLPYCTACRASLSVDVLAAAIGRTVACACGETIVVRRSDAETAAWDPRIAFVVGDGKGQGGEVSTTHAEGKSVACNNCGAALEPNGARRAAVCKFCGVTNLLGDTVWRKLNPTPERLAFFLVYDVDAALELELCRRLLPPDDRHADVVGGHYSIEPAVRDRIRARLERVATEARVAEHAALLAGSDVITIERARDVVRSDMSDADARTLDARFADATRVALAAEPPVSSAFVKLWARSPSPELRAIIARRPALSRDLLDALARDGSAQVRASLAARAELDADITEILAADSDTAIRATIASRADASNDVLTRLRKDSNADVVASVKANPSFKPGFFKKLFG